MFHERLIEALIRKEPFTGINLSAFKERLKKAISTAPSEVLAEDLKMWIRLGIISSIAGLGGVVLVANSSMSSPDLGEHIIPTAGLITGGVWALIGMKVGLASIIAVNSIYDEAEKRGFELPH